MHDAAKAMFNLEVCELERDLHSQKEQHTKSRHDIWKQNHVYAYGEYVNLCKPKTVKILKNSPEVKTDRQK